MESRTILKIWKMSELKLHDRRTGETITTDYYIIDTSNRETVKEHIFDNVDRLGYSYCGFMDFKLRTLDLNAQILYESANEADD